MKNLPTGFEALEPFVEQWDCEDFQQRFERRYESGMDAIQAFYDVISPLADQALAECERYPLHEMPEDVARLYRLLMASAHIALAVERHRQVQPKGITYPTSLRVTQNFGPR